MAEGGARIRIFQKIGNSGNPVCAVGVVDHGEDFHARIFRIEKRHDLVIHRTDRAALHDIEEFSRLLVDALHVAVGADHVQPVGIEHVDLARVRAQRRKAGRVPRNIKRGANAFFLIEFDLRGRELRLAVSTRYLLFLPVAGFFFLTFFQGFERPLLRREQQFRKRLIAQSGKDEKNDERGNQDGHHVKGAPQAFPSRAPGIVKDGFSHV